MANRLAHRRWLLRDIPHVGALTIWALAGFAVLAYCFDGGTVERFMASLSRPAVATKTSSDPGNAAAMYTGSILFVPPRGDLCGQWKFDNRTGALWDNGQVSCRPASGAKPEEVTAARVIAIGKAFKGE